MSDDIINLDDDHDIFLKAAEEEGNLSVDDVIFLDDDEDELLEAVQEAKESTQKGHVQNEDHQPRAHSSRFGVQKNQLQNEDHQPIAHCSTSVGQLYMGSEAPGFDVTAGNTWKYPVDFPKRDYQYNIIKTALYQNTLVCLPTGTGKTFIAAVVMYNFYRWYPQGKVIFMAPTRPLVHQQVNACANFTGLPKESVIVMTGQMKQELRLKEWEEKRVIFCTPQILMNDLQNNTCTAQEVKCVVVDEAHRATGNHAYVQVLKQLVSKSAVFRVLALSATPGNNFLAIQQVVSNLLISRIESRTEASPDIAQYVHHRNIDTVIVSLTGYLKEVFNKFMSVIEIFVRPLILNRLLSGTVRSMAKFKVFTLWQNFRSNPPQHLSPQQISAANIDFAISVALFHAVELLTLNGLRSFINYIKART